MLEFEIFEQRCCQKFVSANCFEVHEATISRAQEGLRYQVLLHTKHYSHKLLGAPVANMQFVFPITQVTCQMVSNKEMGL